jgi:hypothetical protein
MSSPDRGDEELPAEKGDVSAPDKSGHGDAAPEGTVPEPYSAGERFAAPLPTETAVAASAPLTGAHPDASAIKPKVPTGVDGEPAKAPPPDSPSAANAGEGSPQHTAEAQELELAEARKRRRQWLHHTERDDPEEAFQKERPFLQHIPLAAIGAGTTEVIPEVLLQQLRRNPCGDSRASALAYSLGFGGRLLLQSAALCCRRLTGAWRPPPKGCCIRRICARKIDAETGTVYYWCALCSDVTALDAEPDSWRWLRRRTLQRLAPQQLLDFDRRHPEPPHIPRIEIRKQQGLFRYTREALDPCLLRLDIASGRLRLEVYGSHVELLLPEIYVRPYRPTLHLAGKVRTEARAETAEPKLAQESTSSFYARLRNALTGTATDQVVSPRQTEAGQSTA